MNVFVNYQFFVKLVFSLRSSSDFCQFSHSIRASNLSDIPVVSVFDFNAVHDELIAAFVIVTLVNPPVTFSRLRSAHRFLADCRQDNVDEFNVKGTHEER